MKHTPDIIFERELNPGESFDKDSYGEYSIGDLCQVWVPSLNEFYNGRINDFDRKSDPPRYQIVIMDAFMLWTSSLYPPS